MNNEILTTTFCTVSGHEGIHHQRLVVRIKRHVENADNRNGAGKEYAKPPFKTEAIQKES